MIKINIFGDFCVRKVAQLSFGQILQEHLANANFNIINFEAPIETNDGRPIKKSGPHITNDKYAPSFLLNHGFNLFNLANNHILDFGENGLKATIRSFPSNSIMGVGSWEQAYKPLIIHVCNCKIAFVSATHHEFGVLYNEYYQKNKQGAAWMLHSKIDEMILKARRECNFLYMYIHGGQEHEFYPLPEFRTLYRHFINMGADGVIASHPHTPQPWEIYKGKPIYYSLGNFCFERVGKYEHPYWYWGLVVQLQIDGDKVNVRTDTCFFDEKNLKVEIDNDNTFINHHIREINDTFRNENKYLVQVEKQCAKYEMTYDMFARKSGYYTYSLKNILKLLLYHFSFKKFISDSTYLLNNFRCESHRWTILKILEHRLNEE